MSGLIAPGPGRIIRPATCAAACRQVLDQTQQGRRGIPPRRALLHVDARNLVGQSLPANGDTGFNLS